MARKGPELRNLLESIADGWVDIRIRAVERFEKAGFSREEAIFMTMDEWWGTKMRMHARKKS